MPTGLCTDRSRPLGSGKYLSLSFIVRSCRILYPASKVFSTWDVLDPDSAVFDVEHRLDCAAACSTSSGISHVRYMFRTMTSHGYVYDAV